MNTAEAFSIRLKDVRTTLTRPLLPLVVHTGSCVPTQMQDLTGRRMWLAIVIMQSIYLRFRRLPPQILKYWGIDLFSAIAMISVH